MFLGHIAVGLAGRRAEPSGSLAIAYFVRGSSAATRRVSFWLLMGFLAIAYFGAAFGPPPADVRTLAFSALALWLLIPWTKWADRSPVRTERSEPRRARVAE